VEPRTPEPSPEGTLIRYWREQAGMSREECVAAYIAAAAARGETGRIAKISVGYWQSVEWNRGSTRGKAGPVRASDPLLARMAAVVPGVTPSLLAAEGQRSRAARMLEEIPGHGPATAAPLPDWAPEAEGQYEARVWQMIHAAERKRRRSRWDLAGPDIFPDSASMAAIWDSPEFGEDQSVRLIARALQEIGAAASDGDQAGGETG
jgi:hypothetical protein